MVYTCCSSDAFCELPDYDAIEGSVMHQLHSHECDLRHLEDGGSSAAISFPL